MNWISSRRKKKQNEALAALLTSNESTNLLTESTPDGLNKLLLTKDQLDQVKKDLNQMIEVMADNPSLFSRASKYWGAIPVWQKIIGGIILIVPTLVIGILFNVSLVIAASIFTLASYVASSIFLDNHYSHISDTTTGLKQGISGLADTLGIVIQSLDSLYQQLSGLVEEFHQENEKLRAKIGDLSGQVTSLSQQIQKLQETVSSLQETKNGLEETAAKLSNSVKENIDLLEKNQKQLDKVQSDYEASQLELSARIAEFGAEKIKLTVEIDKAKEVGNTLRVAVDALSNTVITEETEREAFKDKLDVFIKDKDASLNQLAGRFEEAGDKINALQLELEQTIKKLKELVEQQTKLNARLEASVSKKTRSTANESENEQPRDIGSALEFFGRTHESRTTQTVEGNAAWRARGLN